MTRTTSAEVARIAGVSRATVSLVLNGRARSHGISDDTRAHVVEVAGRVGYQPNHAARSLRRRRSNVLAFLAHSIDSFYNTEVVSAAQAVAQARGYTLATMSVKTEDLQRRAFGLLFGGMADGVVVAAPPDDMTEGLRTLAANGAPVVVLQHLSPDAHVQSVRVDLEQGGYLATRHLIGLGHRRIAHIAYSAQHLQRRADRSDGYQRAMREAGLPIEDGQIVLGEASLEGGFEAMRRLMTGLLPTAVFVYNDQMAIGAIHALRAAGLAVPEDVAIVGFDGIALGRFVTPELTTVDYPRAEIGRLAVETVIGRLEGGDEQPHERVLPVQLVVRRSCGARPVGEQQTPEKHQGRKP